MNIRKFILLLITLTTAALLYGQGEQNADRTKVNKVVIDPGHGGKHPGCVHKNYLEKDLTLRIGLLLGEMIEKNYPEVKVIYTRKTDKYVDLAERGKIANNASADLFISIHINSSEKKEPSGTSTYIMGMDKSNQNLDVAMKENDVIIYEDDYTTKYEGYTPGDPASYIMFSLMQYAYRDQSMMFAEIIQKHFGHDLPMKDRGAFQGPFLVLWRTSMPSVLTEIGFMSNDKDRAYITTQKGQREAARSLFNAFSEYKSKVEGRASVVLMKETPASSESTRENNSTGRDSRGDDKRERVSSTNIKYYVQIAASNRSISTSSREFKSYAGKVTRKRVGRLYKYLVGGYDTFAQAQRSLAEVKKSFSQAFVVAFDGDDPIGVDEARAKTE